MEDKSKYFVVKQKAVPEVLLKVVEAKKLLETEREHSGQRRDNAYAERGGKGEYRQCFQHDRGTGSIGRNPLRQNTCQGVMTGLCLSISEENKTQGAEDYD